VRVVCAGEKETEDGAMDLGELSGKEEAEAKEDLLCASRYSSTFTNLVNVAG